VYDITFLSLPPRCYQFCWPPGSDRTSISRVRDSTRGEQETVVHVTANRSTMIFIVSTFPKTMLPVRKTLLTNTWTVSTRFRARYSFFAPPPRRRRLPAGAAFNKISLPPQTAPRRFVSDQKKKSLAAINRGPWSTSPRLLPPSLVLSSCRLQGVPEINACTYAMQGPAQTGSSVRETRHTTGSRVASSIHVNPSVEK